MLVLNLEDVQDKWRGPLLMCSGDLAFKALAAALAVEFGIALADSDKPAAIPVFSGAAIARQFPQRRHFARENASRQL